MALSVSALVQLKAQLTSALDLTTVSAPLSVGRQINLADGDGAGEANVIWSDTRTLAASDDEDIDLAGELVDPLGQTIAFGKIKGLLIAASSSNTNDVVIGAADSNAWVGPFGADTDTLTIRPGGVLLLVAPDAAGYAVTGGTGDLLKVANGGAGSSVTYDIVIFGVASS